MKVFLFLISCCFFAATAMAQSGVPQAMKYQSVARDKFGIELKNKKISIQISLISKKYGTPLTYYVETQQVMTNELGLFNVAIGEGTVVSGNFTNVPWYTDDIWMNIDVKDQDWKPFENIASSRLLTVPYAFHSATASHIVGVADGNLTNIWSLKGNRNINPETDKLGTIDSLDLKMITNNFTRLTIQANGLIDIAGSLHVGDSLAVDGDLIAKKNVYLNVNSGITIAHGNTTFEQHVLLNNASLQSTAPNNGALVVSGGVGVGRNLNVGQAMTVADTVGFRSPQQSYTPGTGALVVAGGAGIGKTLNVGSALKVADTVSFTSAQQSFSPATGSLVVAGGAGIGKTLNVGSALKVADTVSFTSAQQSFSPATGALVITGGAGIGKTLNVGSALKVADTVSLTSPQQSYTTGTGALVVTGGAGIGKTLNVGGALKVADSIRFNSINQSLSTSTGALVVNGGTGIGGNLNVGGFVRINGDLSFDSNLESTAYTNGALVIKGGVGIAKRLNVNGLATLNNGLDVISGNSYVANFRNTTNANGISIQVQNPVPAMANHFVTFRNQNGGVVGSIQGETLYELQNVDEDYASGLKDQDIAVIFAAIDVATAALGAAADLVTQVGADASSTGCVGLGACVTAPVPSLIVASGINLGLSVANVITTTAAVAVAAIQRQDYIDAAAASVGVTYQSGAGDYAEWLPKNKSLVEKFHPGDIVAVKDGMITLNTQDATQLMVISRQPIVLGNMQQNNAADFEKVAFMGQVPVKVYGKVNPGDYIVPDQKNNGAGRAIAPNAMTPADFKNIVGVAWSASVNDVFNYINTAVGLNANALAKVVTEQGEEIKKQAGEIAEIKAMLAKLTDRNTGVATTPATASSLKMPVAEIPDMLKTGTGVNAGSLPPSIPYTGLAEDRIVYYQLSPEQVNTIWSLTEARFKENGGDINTNIFWKRFKTDAAYNAEIKRLYLAKINDEMVKQKIMNRQFSQTK